MIPLDRLLEFLRQPNIGFKPLLLPRHLDIRHRLLDITLAPLDVDDICIRVDQVLDGLGELANRGRLADVVGLSADC